MRVSVETHVYNGLSIGDKSGDLRWTLAYFSGEQSFSTRDISHIFVAAQRNLAALERLANRNVFPEFHELWSGGPVIPCGDMHQSFIDAHVNWFFDNFPMFSYSFRLVFIHCILRGLSTSFLYECGASRGSSLRQHGLLVLELPRPTLLLSSWSRHQAPDLCDRLQYKAYNIAAWTSERPAH